jgi:hypothetical protein
MKCALKRFGPGVQNIKPTVASKEVTDNLQKMKDERAKQDAMWTTEKKDELIRDATKR